jgi:lipopolysaccharide/colanic/teichoic acid biosynthesis glycosyltransferase
VFGHVPVAEINAAWFQYIMHPRYSPITPHAKRALDLIVGIALGLFFLPILTVCALLIRRDGGPALFKQARIGEGGRPLAVYKLRTMVVDAGLDSQWASPGDPRITRIGATLRRLHLDELPQIINVLRGEMSIVGPRPEQPEFVERLEGLLPFYSRRHLIKPGITGWAQVRCGYAGSDVGSAWKLCHDLYYLKYRSTAFDLSILAETLGAIFGVGEHAINTSTVRFVQSEPAPLES